jgi:hypothetical protein
MEAPEHREAISEHLWHIFEAVSQKSYLGSLRLAWSTIALPLYEFRQHTVTLHTLLAPNRSLSFDSVIELYRNQNLLPQEFTIASVPREEWMRTWERHRTIKTQQEGIQFPDMESVVEAIEDCRKLTRWTIEWWKLLCCSVVLDPSDPNPAHYISRFRSICRRQARDAYSMSWNRNRINDLAGKGYELHIQFGELMRTELGDIAKWDFWCHHTLPQYREAFYQIKKHFGFFESWLKPDSRIE